MAISRKSGKFSVPEYVDYIYRPKALEHACLLTVLSSWERVRVNKKKPLSSTEQRNCTTILEVTRELNDSDIDSLKQPQLARLCTENHIHRRSQTITDLKRMLKQKRDGTLQYKHWTLTALRAQCKINRLR